MLVGRGALGATAEVTQVADALGAGVAKALLGRTVLADREPWVTGPIGLLGSTASWHLMQECDTLLIVGSNLPYGEFLPPEGAARGVQIDVDGRRLGFRYPTEVNLVGDSAATLVSSSRCSIARTTGNGASASRRGRRSGGRPSSAARCSTPTRSTPSAWSGSSTSACPPTR